MNQYGDKTVSSVEWFGNIPANWTVKRIKALFDLHDERSYLPLDEVNLISLYSNIGVRQHTDIKHTTGNKARNADGYKIVAKDDIVVNILLCWMGAIGCSAYDGVTSPAYDIYTPKENVNSQYYHYLFRLPAFSQQCYKVGKGIMSMRWRTYSPQFRNIVVPFPSLTEQDQIVRFLDWKTSSINRLISNYRHEISLLNETKQRLIDDTVIKGMNKERLAHNADIRWELDYPEHWKLQRTRESFTFRKGLSITKANLEETGIAVISYGQVHSKKNTGVGLNNELFRYVDESYLTSNQNAVVEKGDFIFADTSEDMSGCGNCVYVDWDETIFAGYHSIIAHPNGMANNKYLAYLFKSSTWRYQIHKKVNGVKVYSITQKMLKDTFILIPPGDEQEEIVHYLDTVCTRINEVIKRIEEKIANLQELKMRLISDTVTGKIDVRGIEIPEYEFVDEDADDNTEDNHEEDTEDVEEQGNE